jgi:hypothetical protein
MVGPAEDAMAAQDAEQRDSSRIRPPGRIWSALLLVSLAAGVPESGVWRARAQNGAAVKGAKERRMESQWLAEGLAKHGFQFVLFQYEPSKVESLESGPKAAINSSRLWQEQIMTPAFEIPDRAETGIHRNHGDDPDALSFRYESGEYIVHCFHVMDRLAITLRPSEERSARLRITDESVKDVATRLAGEVFQHAGEFQFEMERQASPMAIGRETPPAGKTAEELFPVEQIEWWYDGREFGFGVPKVTPIINGHYPASMGPSAGQVLKWFATYGMKRWLK